MINGRFISRILGLLLQVIAIFLLICAAVAWGYGEEDLEDAVRERLSAWLKESGIGGTLQAGNAWALVQNIPGVLQVREVNLSTTTPGCYQNEEGDILLPRRAIPRLGALRVERLPNRGSGR